MGRASLRGRLLRGGQFSILQKVKFIAFMSHSDDEEYDYDGEDVDIDDAEEEEEEKILTAAENKLCGNEAYKKKDYREAIKYYTLSIDIAEEERRVAGEDGGDSDDAVCSSYYSNR